MNHKIELSAETLRRIVRSTARVAAFADFTTDAAIDEHLREFVDIDAPGESVAPDAETLRRWRDLFASAGGSDLFHSEKQECADAMREIDALLDGKAREEWRLVDRDGLPEDSLKPLLACYESASKKRSVIMVKYSGMAWRFLNEREKSRWPSRIIAWMPLPKPPVRVADNE